LEVIKVRVDAADTVLAVWREPGRYEGRQIKGASALRTGHIGKLLGIPCAGPAEAEALFREFGDRDPWDAPAH